MSTEAHPIIAVPYVLEIVAFLVTVVVLVPLMKRIKVSPVLGYLAVGAIIGPYAMGWVSDVAGVQHVAELGVIFLLFTIGLELSFERLRAYSQLIFGFGSLQVGITAIVIALVAWLWGNDIQAAIIIGLCLALSSTAMVMQLLAERGENATVHGRTSFAALLLQDLAVVPILIGGFWWWRRTKPLGECWPCFRQSHTGCGFYSRSGALCAALFVSCSFFNPQC